ncbi:hypothetical protein COCOBI_03-7170 [Coccomyxa sp. Obi]|nr:hypothetical protein COCOBI_03-7170 [Coccomyxa sp. Obi]
MDLKQFKQQIIQQSGDKNGLDRSSAQAQQISELINELETKGQLEDIKLTGTQWRLVYTSSTASSSGKIGPFIGRVFQVFPQDQLGQYINKVDFGLVKADLLANYKQPARDRIDVAFEYIHWQLGPLQFKQDISQGRPDTSGGFWKLSYTDEDFRVLYTNRGNVFVLVRE